MDHVKKRILVVDDEEKVTKYLKLGLEVTGHFIVKTENVATHALEAARQFDPDLILLDLMMPELEGSILASEFLEHSRFKDVPIVFLTALATPREVREHRGLIGGLPFLAKPVDMPEMIECLNKQLATRTGNHGSAGQPG